MPITEANCSLRCKAIVNTVSLDPRAVILVNSTYVSIWDSFSRLFPPRLHKINAKGLRRGIRDV